MRIEFTVEGRPPRKQQTTSMWSQPKEAKLVANLRVKALEAMKKAGLNECFNSHVSLDITLVTPYSILERIGDLDTFITGICDGLQAAHNNAHTSIHELFQNPAYSEIDPRRPLLIMNDSQIMSITAKKKSLQLGQGMYYAMYYKVAVDSIESPI